MTLPYDVGPAIGTAATLGLIVLRTDETIEAEFRPLFAGTGIALHTTRVPFAPQVTPETLREMEAHLPEAASLLPGAARFDAIAYACTSGATVIGPAKVAEILQTTIDAGAVTDPLTATCAALRHLRIRTIAYLSPYVASVTAPMRAALDAAGTAVLRHASFNEPDDARVARIAPSSTAAAAASLGSAADIDAVFVSCTNLQTFSIIEDLERQLQKPVLSSNQVLAWHLQTLAGIRPTGPGRLFREGRR